MKHSRIVCTVFVVLVLSACIRIEPQPMDANAVAVGISMKIGHSSAPQVYFVRLEEKQDILRQDRLIDSDRSSNDMSIFSMHNLDAMQPSLTGLSLPATLQEVIENKAMKRGQAL
jgi:hypothetical protein